MTLPTLRRFSFARAIDATMLSNVEKAEAFVLHDRFTNRDVSLDHGTLAALAPRTVRR